MLCESSRYWNETDFKEKQEDIIQYKNKANKVFLMGNFNARTGNLFDYIDTDGVTLIVPRFDLDKNQKQW